MKPSNGRRAANGLAWRFALPPAAARATRRDFVEFVARFNMDGKAHIHHETGRFAKQDEHWYYVDGVMGVRPRYRTQGRPQRSVPLRQR